MNQKEEPHSVHTSHHSPTGRGGGVRDKALIKRDPQSLIILTASAAVLINGLDVGDTDPLSVPWSNPHTTAGLLWQQKELTHILYSGQNADTCVQILEKSKLLLFFYPCRKKVKVPNYTW